MTATVRPPKVDDTVTFAWITDKAYRIADIYGSDGCDDGWGYTARVEHGNESWTTTLWQGDYGTPTGWEYVR